MTRHERASIGIATLALLLSSVSFYFQFFYVSESVILSKIKYGDLSHPYELALFNNGSQEVIIREFSFSTDAPSVSAEIAVDFPYTLKPSQSLLVPIMIQLNAPLDSSGVVDYDVFVQYQAVGGRGRAKGGKIQIGSIFLENARGFNGSEILLQPVELL